MDSTTFSGSMVGGQSGASSVTKKISGFLEKYGSSSSYLQGVIDSVQEELMVIDRDYRIVQVNKALLQKHRGRQREVIGHHCYEIAHDLPDICHPPNHECPFKAVWETGKQAQVTHVHTCYTQDEKRETYLDIVISPVRDSQGNVIAVTEVMRDVTEAKRLELELAKAREDLLALNTIASVVTQSLDLDTVLSSALDKTLEIMQRSTGGILLLDEEKQILSYRVYRGLSKKYASEMRLGLGEGIAGIAAQTMEAILVEDILKDSRVAHPDLIAAEGIRAFVSVPLHSKGKVLGVINIASHEVAKLSSGDMRLLDSIAAQIAIALENARLHQEVRRKEGIRGELLQGIFSIQEEERRRIARELHDETSQVLASLSASLEAAAGMLPPGANESKVLLKNAQALSITILDGIHKLIYELRPLLLDDLGLVAATRWLADNNLEAAGVKVSFKTEGRVKRLAPQLETTVFRVIQEAVYNIARHAHAKKVDINLHFKKGIIRVRVSDDGIGFDVEEAISSKDRPRGLGLLGMRERVELFNGIFSIISRPGGGGTGIDIQIPTKYEVFNGEDKDTASR